jgi:hypothetical protein
MKLLAFSTLLLFAFALPPEPRIKLEVGAKLDRRYIPRKLPGQILTNPAQTRPFIERSVAGIKYLIAFDAKTREIKYINTTDSNFRTAAGLRVDSEIPLTREQLEIFPYWEIRAPKTSDGWYPVVAHDSDLSGFDWRASFKGNETQMFTIEGFSKGDH